MAEISKEARPKLARTLVPILGIGVDSTEPVEALKRAWDYILCSSEANSKLKTGTAKLVVTPNPEIVSRAQSDLVLAQIINKADLAVPDGVGVVAAARFLHPNSKMIRVSGRLLAEELVKLCSKHNKKVFLLGGQPGAAQKAAKNLKKHMKNYELRIMDAEGPWLDNSGKPVDRVQEQIEKDLIKQINKFAPDLLLVGFGAPKQEKWLDRNLPKLKVGVAMVVGGMIDYTAEILPLPPRAFERLGFEWLWRLITQPRRVGRIFTATVIFPWQVFLYKLMKKSR